MRLRTLQQIGYNIGLMLRLIVIIGILYVFVHFAIKWW